MKLLLRLVALAIVGSLTSCAVGSDRGERAPKALVVVFEQTPTGPRVLQLGLRKDPLIGATPLASTRFVSPRHSHGHIHARAPHDANLHCLQIHNGKDIVDRQCAKIRARIHIAPGFGHGAASVAQQPVVGVLRARVVRTSGAGLHWTVSDPMGRAAHGRVPQ